MGIAIKPSDLKYRYPRDTVNRDLPKFSGAPDPAPFKRNDLYEIVPMMAAVMDALQCDDQRVLHLIEDILNNCTPHFIRSREEVFDFLVGMARDQLSQGQAK